MLATQGLNLIRRRYYYFVGLSISYRSLRWCLTISLVGVYLYRALGLSYDVITYLIGFYLLQLLVSYLTPKGLDDDEDLVAYDEFADSLIIESIET